MEETDIFTDAVRSKKIIDLSIKNDSLSPFRIYSATANRLPIVVSVPHCGVNFPGELRAEYNPELIQTPDDTDWFVDTLYDFVPAMGITMISAEYSRWVIDLNREVNSKPLYTDGRIITGLCPTTTFLGEPLYKDGRTEVSADDVTSRLNTYYYPYHEKIQSLMEEAKSAFGKVLLWDCHSIRQVVPTIQREKFPDLILGDADERACSSGLIDIAVKNLSSSTYSFSHNHPFKGGTITRSFGRPDANQYALQLEMTKVNYMDDQEKKYNKARADKMRALLKTTLSELGDELLK